jgi:DNA-binding transcriptional ArsR family regulator
VETTNLAEEVIRLHADICSALADPSRIMLIYALSSQACNVSDLASQVGISQPAASRHLKILRDRGLVKAMRLGANVVYSLTDTRLVEALDLLRAILRDRINYRASIMENGQS